MTLPILSHNKPYSAINFSGKEKPDKFLFPDSQNIPFADRGVQALRFLPVELDASLGEKPPELAAAGHKAFF